MGGVGAGSWKLPATRLGGSAGCDLRERLQASHRAECPCLGRLGELLECMRHSTAGASAGTGTTRLLGLCLQGRQPNLRGVLGVLCGLSKRKDCIC